MAGKIYLLSGDSDLIAMEEAPYDSEKLLQEMLVKHPDLLAGDQINSEDPRRWLLVTREMSVPGEEGSNGRWSLDHLFLDQDAVPTLVEVKRSSDTRIRREVIGQMLDYAANAVVYWPVEEVRAKFQARCEEDSQRADAAMTTLLGADCDVDEFWQRVKTNLQAGRIRMVFLADAIPAELRRVVEFLNEQMDPAEVIAIEVKQFIGTGVKTLVPRVIGQSETARQKKSSGGAARQWDEASFFEALQSRRGTPECEVARKCLAWANARKLRIWWGQGKHDGSLIPVYDNDVGKNFIFSLWTYGKVELQFQYMRTPPFAELAMRQKFARRLCEIDGVAIADEALTRRPTFGLELLVDPESLTKFLAACDWALAEIDNATTRLG
ncbi:hypothetical protein Poly51_23830 [Rubripirellula tenax]|uniref:DUF4268 domain-containing protein n=1 Tax=Rubripirellula tenax TaxID=2528015 RepID=A0A5C6F662_9BACT|nr:hypothetical protein [Rubripirellula tenax]TWU56472.1 hypothetical protein Poly51_23830 [Rubripirellula tenax]